MHLVFFMLHHLLYSSSPSVMWCCWECSALPLITFQSFKLDMKRKLLKACLIQKNSQGKGLVGGQDARSLGRGLFMAVYLSWKQWVQAHFGACSTLPSIGPAPSDSESSSKGGVTAFQSSNTGLLVWLCADERTGWNSSLGDGCMAEGDRFLMLDVTKKTKKGKTKKEGELELSFRIHSPVELLYAFNGIHMWIRPHA